MVGNFQRTHLACKMSNFGHHENRNGYDTEGEYHVLLPDGRLQTVNYHVDGAYGGYVADVQYTGEVIPHPAPAYHEPVPIYVGAADPMIFKVIRK